MGDRGERSYDGGWLAQLDRARRLQQTQNFMRQHGRGTRKPLPRWAQAQLRTA